jgi:tetratricopeptide (TPR) repeat protein
VLYRKALELNEKSLGVDHPDTAREMGALAGCLYLKGDYAGAEQMYRQALTLDERVLGVEHRETVTVLSNLALLLNEKGDREGAMSLYLRVLPTMEKVFGREHLMTATVLSNAAQLLSGDGGDYATAEQMYRRVLAIREKVLGPEHPDTGLTLNNLAETLVEEGSFEEAAALYQRALGILEKALGAEHPTVADLLSNMGLLQFAKKDYAAAEALYRRALNTRENVLGPEHPNTEKSLEDLGLLLCGTGQRNEGRVLLERASRQGAASLSRWLLPFDETGQRTIVASIEETDGLISCHLAQPDDKETARAAFWAVLQAKGRLQEIRTFQQRLARRQPQLFTRWSVAQRALDLCLAYDAPGASSAFLAGRLPCASGGSDFTVRQQTAREALQALYDIAPREQQDLGVLEFGDLLGALRGGTWALVEIVRFNAYPPLRARGGSDAWHRYAVYVLFADARIEAADLGDADRIDGAVARLRGLQSDPSARLAAVRKAAQELYGLTMGKLEDVLKGQSKLYVAADGDLGLIDFSSLVDRQGQWFIANHLVANLTSGRDLVRLRRAEDSVKDTHGDYLVANPSFLFRDTHAARATSARSANSAKATLSAPAFSCSSAFARGAAWPRVGITPGQIAGFRAAIPGLRILEREQAREGAVKQINRPRSLWFITHGFFCALRKLKLVALETNDLRVAILVSSLN